MLSELPSISQAAHQMREGQLRPSDLVEHCLGRIEKLEPQVKAWVRVDADGASVGLVELSTDHAFAHLKPTDNVVQFTTARYRDNPLVVQGPGAGPEVTAAGVFADLLRVAHGLGTRL